MLDIIIQLCGGIGLFLIGMTLMTDSLKEMAGEQLRLWLSRLTGSSITAMFSGIILTLAVQSSTATTLATIGFVSAGVLTLTQAIGIVVGANIGSTGIGWLVALFGLKFSISAFAFPLIGIGSLMKLLLKGKLALLGLTFAGFGLLFYGIDILQVALSGFSEQVNLTQFSSGTILSQLFLVLVGVVMTIILQSSGAAVAATLAALATGTIDLQQALNLVIGQNIGTVATAVLAAMGSTVNAKRTAAVHVIFNIIAAVFAFILLKPLFLWLYEHHSWVSSWDHIVVVAAFHTAFSVLGAFLILPVIEKFEKMIRRLIPDNAPSILSYLDQGSLSMPGLAIQAASKVLNHTLIEMLKMMTKAIQEGQLPMKERLQQLDEVIAALQHYLADIPFSDRDGDQKRLEQMLRMMVYVDVLRSDLEHIEHVNAIRTQPMIYQMGLDYIGILSNYRHVISETEISSDVMALNEELLNLKRWVDEQRSEIRNNVMEYVSIHHLNAGKGVELLAAQRWLDRVIAHTQRLANVMSDEVRQDRVA